MCYVCDDVAFLLTRINSGRVDCECKYNSWKWKFVYRGSMKSGSQNSAHIAPFTECMASSEKFARV